MWDSVKHKHIAITFTDTSILDFYSTPITLDDDISKMNKQHMVVAVTAFQRAIRKFNRDYGPLNAYVFCHLVMEEGKPLESDMYARGYKKTILVRNTVDEFPPLAVYPMIKMLSAKTITVIFENTENLRRKDMETYKAIFLEFLINIIDKSLRTKIYRALHNLDLGL